MGGDDGKWQRGGTWYVKVPAGVSYLLLVSLSAMSMVRAAEHSAVDADFLEFLGSVDSGGKGWHEYLENTDLEKVAQSPVKSPVKPPADKPPESKPDKGSDQ